MAKVTRVQVTTYLMTMTSIRTANVEPQKIYFSPDHLYSKTALMDWQSGEILRNIMLMQTRNTQNKEKNLTGISNLFNDENIKKNCSNRVIALKSNAVKTTSNCYRCQDEEEDEE